MLVFLVCKDDSSAQEHMKAGGEHDDLSKMQRADGERMATGVITGSSSAPLYQLRAGPGSVDCAESHDPVAYKAAGPECGLMIHSSL